MFIAGRGLDFYPTDSLKEGRMVQVYAHDADGWLRIRPPRGSFSWVRASSLQPSENPSVAQVVNAEVAWVGALVGRVRQHKWQVRLEAGEHVEIVGDKRRLASMGDAAAAWYKIAPPAGEFRWIHERNVRRKVPQLAAEPPSEDLLPTAVADDSIDGVATAVVGEIAASDLPADCRYECGSCPTTRSPSSKGSLNRRPLPRAMVLLRDAIAPSRHSVQATRPTKHRRLRPAAPLRKVRKAAGFADLLRVIDLDLSLMVAQETSQWRLTELRKQTETLVGKGGSALERGRARLLLDKIARFESIQQGHTTTATVAATGEALYVPPLQVASTTTLTQAACSSAASNVLAGTVAAGISQRYDGVGWLLPVHAQQSLAPRFALTDDAGKVLQYVVPAPGRNLHRHLRKQVGILGQYHGHSRSRRTGAHGAKRHRTRSSSVAIVIRGLR